MGNFKVNKAGLRKLERNLQTQFTAGIEVPTGGSEDAAVRSVKEQLKRMGLTPNESEVRKMVREARTD